jgi:hypothetical protein
MVEASPD